MKPEMLHNLLKELKHSLVVLYGERLSDVYLYGSYARGEQDDQSDLDVMIVLDDYERYGEEIDTTSELASSFSLKYGVSISMVFLREQEWLEANTPLLRNARVDAIPV
jgi:uncharacterized protein